MKVNEVEKLKFEIEKLEFEACNLKFKIRGCKMVTCTLKIVWFSYDLSYIMMPVPPKPKPAQKLLPFLIF